MQVFTSLRRAPRLVALLAIVVIVGAGAVAYAGGYGPGTTEYTPNKADQITNIDVLRQEIKNYFGTPDAKTGVPEDVYVYAAPDSNYARETESVASKATHWIAARARVSNPAIVLDVDDTTLSTWNYELYSNWDYNPSTNTRFVNAGLFPAVPGMVDMVDQAVGKGYTVFFLTGRPTSQYTATLDNLANVGYPTPAELFTKPHAGDPVPPYLTCETSCSTIEYKSLTREHIEDMGYEIVANFGDQYSDLIGGYADRTFKMPNPNYYLP